MKVELRLVSDHGDLSSASISFERAEFAIAAFYAVFGSLQRLQGHEPDCPGPPDPADRPPADPPGPILSADWPPVGGERIDDRDAPPHGPAAVDHSKDY